MAYSVTSWFVDQAASENPPIKRQFLIGTSDYSGFVLGWPTISSQWDELRPNNVTLNLANEDQTFNFFKTAKTNLQASCSIKYGFTHPTSGDELLTLFSGTVQEIQFENASATLRLNDKVQKLSDRIVGTTNSAAVFSSATMLPSDIAWTVCTCYGGFSSIASTSNPDIDYTAFLEWAQVFSDNAVYVGANYKGQNVTEVLRGVMRNTQSAAYLNNDKIKFSRWTYSSTSIVNLTGDHIKSLRAKIRADAMINRQWVEFDYRVESNYWNKSIFSQNTASVNSFGIRENVIRDENFWYVGSNHAMNLADRSLRVNANPYEEVTVEAILKPLYQTVGDTLAAYDPHLEITEGWRIMGMSINIDTGGVTMNIDGSQINTPFILDVSSLDGTDLLL